jgi:hypothetical protein
MPNRPRIVFNECGGHDGYQKNPLSMQISKKSSYLIDKMHLEKLQAKILQKTYYGAPEGGK